jgi:hypothetical protein
MQQIVEIFIPSNNEYVLTIYLLIITVYSIVETSWIYSRKIGESRGNS